MSLQNINKNTKLKEIIIGPIEISKSDGSSLISHEAFGD